MVAKRFPGAKHHIRGVSPGRMDGYKGIKKLEYHDEGVNRGYCDSLWLANYVNTIRSGYHYTYSWWDDEFTSIYDYDQGARASKSGGIWRSTNNRGAVNIQVCAGGFSATHGTKLSDKPMKPNWIAFTRWLKAVGVPEQTHVSWTSPNRSWSGWEKSGWVSHRHAPGNDHVDGTELRVQKLWTPTQNGCDDVALRYAAIRGPKELTIPPGEARWIRWPGRETSWHPENSPSFLMRGPVTATLELRTDGGAYVVFQTMKRGSGPPRRRNHWTKVVTGRTITTDQLKVRKGYKFRVKVINRGVASIRVDRSQIRLSWCA